MKKWRLVPATLVIVWAVSTVSQAQQALTFHRAIELALQHSTTMGMAVADQQRAYAGTLEARNQYLPQMNLGSGIAYSNGFPLSIEGSAPAIFNVNSSQFLFNAAQKQFLRAARSDYAAAITSTEDRRQQTILDAAATYAELDKDLASVRVLREQSQFAARAEEVAHQRSDAGLDAPVEYTKARLASARIRLAAEKAQSDAEMLRLHLAQLTGLKIDDIQTVTESIPKLPPVPTDESWMQKAVDESPVVKMAEQQAQAKEFRAAGEKKQLYPALDLAGQYGLLARYNNYDEFFRKFQRNNITIGVVVRFPFLNFAQKAHAAGAVAEAIRSRSEAQAVKDQVASDTLRMERNVQQLAAARDVAKLEYDLATSEAEAVGVRVQAGSATVRDQENSRVEQSAKYSALLDANIDLDKAQMQLLRASGTLESWALGKP